jgi:Protein of unknown function (DUF1064)
MPRFNHTTQKFDQTGQKVLKGRNGLKEHTTNFPDLIIFDSKSEYELYCKFLEMQDQGQISQLECKKAFPLVPKTRWWNNVKSRTDIVRELTYISDFCFVREGKKVCVDCKGWKLRVDKKSGKEKFMVYYDDIYKIKKKLFLWLYPDYIFEEM